MGERRCFSSLGGILEEGGLHSLMSGKYAQKRLIGSRTVCLNRHSGVSEVDQALDEKKGRSKKGDALT